MKKHLNTDNLAKRTFDAFRSYLNNINYKAKCYILSSILIPAIAITGCNSANSAIMVDNVTNSSPTAPATPGTPSTPDVTNATNSNASPVSPPTDTSKEEANSPSEEELYSPSQINIIMVGDILLHTPVEKAALHDGTYNYDAIFANTINEISSADLALVNQEVIIGGEELGVSGYPCFNAPYELGDCLVATGFDVICHATNHAMDKGKAGLLNCIDYWNEEHPDIAVLGINESEEARDDIFIYEQDDIKIAILDYTYGTNGIPLPSDMPYAVNLLDEQKVIIDIEIAENLADFTIVCPHWGTEYLLEPTSYQDYWNRIFLENGVDLVLGTHPHVIEPIEMLTDETTGHEMLCYYSLGNYVNWTSGYGQGVANRMVGGLANVTISKNDKEEVTITDYYVDALVCHVSEGTDGVTTYLLRDYTPELAAQNEIIKQDASFSYEYCIELCNKVWGNIWE